ncbi:phosphopantetheine adenylyltransferase [archaeon SCG-AAA382B04]|nr:phosphopantetheine adenylyltransferase [archaeon SCG-AAA382B04]
MKVAIGGTFSLLHAGHTYLLKKALSIGDEITIGLSSDKMVSKDGKSFKKRKNSLKEFLSQKNFNCKYEIIKLEDEYGPAIHEDFDAIVVSPETEKTAEEINEIRQKKGLDQIEVIVTDLILAEDWKPISSTRIRKGEINNKGKIIKDN